VDVTRYTVTRYTVTRYDHWEMLWRQLNE